MKGNDGKAAQARLIKKILAILLLFGVLIFALSALGFGPQSQGQESHRRPLLDGGVREKLRERLKRGPAQSFLKFFKGLSIDPKVIDVDLETDNEYLQALLDGGVNLVDISSRLESMEGAPEDSYIGVKGWFCPLDFSLHKQDPTSVPMFRHLVEGSSGCRHGKRFRVDLKQFAAMARVRDQQQTANGSAKVLKLGGVAFHESRCGSTLVANALTAMNPTKHRVYSESAPPLAAIRNVCGETYKFCQKKQAAALLRDVVYLMSRTDDPNEERVFFKIQSIGSRNIEVFQTAFPQTPWVYVYREPVQVMMSQLKHGAKHANCVAARNKKSELVREFVIQHDTNVEHLSDEEYCAVHLATLTESATKAIDESPTLGTPINYQSLPEALYKDILPKKWKIPINQEEIDNIIKISGVYSKGTGGRQGEFKNDSEEKEREATPQIRYAVEAFLQKSYLRLEAQAGRM